MKKMIISLVSIVSFNVVALPLVYDFSQTNKKDKIHIPKIEIVPSKVTEKIISKKNMHGKTVTRKFPIKKMDTGAQDQKKAMAYFEKIRERILKLIVSDKALTKLKGEGIIKIQIQNSGRYDILSINSKNSKISKILQEHLLKIETFSKIPFDLNIGELQIKIHVKVI